MIIDKDYIRSKYTYLIEEKQKEIEKQKIEATKYYRIKQKFPKWLRNIIFNPLNPAYSVYLQYNTTKRKSKNQVKLTLLHPLSVNFVDYCLINDVNFDTNLYYPDTDLSLIISMIENRLKSIISGYNEISLSEQQLEMYDKKQELLNNTKKNVDGYCLTLNNEDYFLPENTFEEHTYIHEYGLSYLPNYIKEYIKDKDFLDVGSFLGDTAIMLLKKYEPKHIYAYEPVEQNANKVRKTIEMNKAENMSIIQKGLGEKDAILDIYIDPNRLSSSSINNFGLNENAIKTEIEITTIDNECINRRVGLIKMDIEGTEYFAIKGGLETIKRDRPVLLISLYHTGKDFFEIPPMLKEAVPEYLFRLIDIEIVNPISEKILIAYPQQ